MLAGAALMKELKIDSHWDVESWGDEADLRVGCVYWGADVEL